MMGIGVGNVPFPPVFDSDRDMIGSEPEASTSLNNDFFKSVNKFNYNVRHILHPHDHAISDATRVIAVPTVGLGVYSNPDRVICDGSSRELKVGIGEIKAPWVLETAGAMAFVNRLPIEHFGGDFVAVTPWRDIQRNVGKGLTQLYHDMIMDGMTVGFLATTEVFFFCLINPEDRTRSSCIHFEGASSRRAKKRTPASLHGSSGIGNSCVDGASQFQSAEAHARGPRNME
jgi:hypothetical protein